MSSTHHLSTPRRATVRLAADRPIRPAPRHEAGFWLAAGAFLIAMAFSTVPTPLYVLYAHEHALSSFMITVIFAVYAVGVIASLIVVGHVSDWLGRKRVLLTAIGVEVVAGLAFISSTQLPMLIIGRLVTGIGVGAITATATAYLHELQAGSRPDGGQRRFDIVSGIANLGGLGIGPLVAGALAQWAPGPLVTPYVVFLVLMVLAALAVATIAPETVHVPRAQRPRYRPQRPRVSGSALGWTLAAASAVSAFAVFGLFTSLAPGFVGQTLGHPSRLLAGTVAFIVFGIAPFAQIASARLAAVTQLALGVAGELVGLALLAIGMEIADLAVFVASAFVLGAGAGVLFRTAIGRTVRVSAPGRRGEALAALFLVSYLGLIVPAIGVGVATRYVEPTTAMCYFSCVLGIVLVVIAILARTAHRADTAAAR
jgi:MFS family permease